LYTKALAMSVVGSQYAAKLLSIDQLFAINIHPLEEIPQVIWARLDHHKHHERISSLLLASPLGDAKTAVGSSFDDGDSWDD